MVTPYPECRSGPKDNYNYYHSQLCIRIECAFGKLVQRWGLLRTAMPLGISIKKTIALVVALAKLHNFCLDQALHNDGSTSQHTTTQDIENILIQDYENITMNEHGSIPLVFNEDAGTSTPDDLIGGGDHFDDVPRLGRRGVVDDSARSKLCIHVANSHKRRPNVSQYHRE